MEPTCSVSVSLHYMLKFAISQVVYGYVSIAFSWIGNLVLGVLLGNTQLLNLLTDTVCGKHE